MEPATQFSNTPPGAWDAPGRTDGILPGAARTLAGRERELTVLRTRLARTLAGHGGLVLVSGEAGIGKTALVAALARQGATQGALVLTGQSYDLDGTPRYGPWAEICAQSPSGAGLPAHDAAFVTGTLAWLRATAARRPLVLILDDLHWADPASLELLRLVSRRAGAQPLLLIGIYRPDDIAPTHPLYTLLPVLMHEAAATRLALRPLTNADLHALVRERYLLRDWDEARLVAYLHERSGGNPLFAGELLRTLEDDGTLQRGAGAWTLDSLTEARVPPLLRQIIDRRVRQLGMAPQELLAVAAVIGQEVPLARWHRVAGVTEEELAGVVERALAASLLVEVPGCQGVRFAHALVREALYEGLALPRRLDWHRRVGEDLLATAAPDPDLVATHFRLAGDTRAVSWLLRAGERAQRSSDWLTAYDRFRVALTLTGEGEGHPEARGWLLARLGWVGQYVDPHAALAALDEALRCGDAGDTPLVLAARFVRGVLCCVRQRLHAGLADLAAVVATLDAQPDPAGTWSAAQDRLGLTAPESVTPRDVLTLGLAYAGRYAEATACARHTAGGGAAPELLQAQARAAAAGGDPAVAAARHRRSRAAYAETDNWFLVAMVALEELQWVALPYAADRPAAARRLAALGEAALARVDGVFTHLPPRYALLPLLLLTGAWAEADRLVGAGQQGGMIFAEVARLTQGTLARARGDAAGAWAAVESGLPAGAASEPGDAPYLSALPLLRLGAALALDSRDRPAARDWLDAHDRWLAWANAVLGQAQGELGWAAYYQAAGDLDRAAHHVTRALEAASAPRQPLALLEAHRLAGALALVAGHLMDAPAHLEQALVLADVCAAPYERALTLLPLAEARLLSGDTGAARAHLDEARAICGPLGARPALALADALAHRLATATPSPPGLTARELEVLRLVAQGLTNAAVAARLGLSRRTVEQHLRAIYDKLRISSRAAATRYAIEHGFA